MARNPNHSWLRPARARSAAAAQLGGALRQLLIAGGAFAAGKGWIDQNLQSALVSILLVVGPMLWSQFIILRGHADKKVMADALPDNIAKAKP